jgi:ribosomal protein S18 acetylase RimI-like enzyme
MGEVERLMRERGCAKINLQVRVGNEDVIEFYKSIGFVVDEVIGMGKRLEKD